MAVATGCFFAPTVDDTDRDPASQGYISPAQIPLLQKEATKACKCERKMWVGGKYLCWGSFWKQANEYRHVESGTACLEGSIEVVDFETVSDSETNMSVMTEWGYGACSDAELPAKQQEYERRTGSQSC
jgi:hypothetical protein